MRKLATIWTFETRNFRITMDALEEFDLDLSWDETGEVSSKLDSGEYVAFCACATVTHKATGLVIGKDYLGNCVYESFEAFKDLVEVGKQNRQWESEGREGRCGSYFKDMVSEAIGEARKAMESLTLETISLMKVRAHQ